jgi:hypothetical protein
MQLLLLIYCTYILQVSKACVLAGAENLAILFILQKNASWCFDPSTWIYF